MEFQKPIPGDQIIGLSAVILVFVSLFHWLGATGTVRSGPAGSPLYVRAASAWGFAVTALAVLLGLVLLGYVVARSLGVDLPDRVGSATLGQIVVGIAGAALFFVLIKIVAGSSLSIPSTVAGAPVTITKSRKFGIYAGLLAAGGLVVGALLSLQAERQGTT